MRGRPTDYSIKLVSTICDRISEGESLRSICRDAEMPNKCTVFNWLLKHKDFQDLYALAREAQADALADEIIYIADTPLLGTKTKTGADGDVETTEGDMIEHRRLQVDARKWVAAKLKPRKYGETRNVEVTGTVTLSDLISRATIAESVQDAVH